MPLVKPDAIVLDRGVRYDELRILIEEWAYDNNICVYPEALATDAASYVFDQLLTKGGVT